MHSTVPFFLWHIPMTSWTSLTPRMSLTHLMMMPAHYLMHNKNMRLASLYHPSKNRASYQLCANTLTLAYPIMGMLRCSTPIWSPIIPLLTPLIDPNWINSELAIALVKIFKIFFILTQNFQLSHLHHHYFHNFCMIHL